MNSHKWAKRLCIILAAVVVIFSASCSYQRRPQPKKQVTPKTKQAPVKQAPIKKAPSTKPALPKTLNAKPGTEPKLKVYIADEKEFRRCLLKNI